MPRKEAESEKPSAFVISEQDISKMLRGGSGFENGKTRIYALYQQQGDAKARVDFLKAEYGIGGYSFTFDDGTHGFVDFSAKGMVLRSYGHDREVRLSWTEVDKRLDQLITGGQYLSPTEMEAYLQLEKDYGAPLPLPIPAHVYPPVQPKISMEMLAEPTAEQTPIFADQPEAEHSELAKAKEPDYRVGDTLYLDGKAFTIEKVGLFDVQLRDPDSVYPIFRAESKENLERLLGHGDNIHLHNVVVDLNPEREPLAIAEESKREHTADDIAEKTNEDSVQQFSEFADELQMSDPVEITAENFRINTFHLGEGSPKQKFRANMDAIYTLKALENQERNATPEEQEILSKYVGWGGLADAFDSDKNAWAGEYKELKAALTDEEYAAARASTLNAHYTSPTVIQAIYEAVGNMGFEKGNILEPSMGVGNFFGMLPDAMQESRLYGVELDSITGRIAQKLYPKAEITVAGFETTDHRDFYDLAVGNVPFGNYRISDKPYDKLSFSIHNYFFAKALDQVRPGGVVAFVTSRYTMDSKNPDARKYLAQRAELLGAIRLPNNAFRANAGTDVVSDIIFLEKRDHPIDIEPDWVYLGLTPEGIALNSYFVDHPEMVLGELATESTQYGKEECTVIPIAGADLGEQLHEAVQQIGGHYEAQELAEEDDLSLQGETIPADPNVKNFSYAVVDGDVYFRENSIMRKADLSATATGRIKGMVELRTIVQELIDYQLNDYPEDAIALKQRELNVSYDSFTDQYGLINSRANAQAFSEDSSYYLLCSLENVDENGRLESKADMFTKRTIRPE